MQFRKKILGGIATILAASTLRYLHQLYLQVISYTIRPLRHWTSLQSMNTT